MKINMESKGILYPLKTHNYYLHQIETANWMKIQETQHPNGFKGGIISLTMGMGKTLLILGYSLKFKGRTPTLIIVPKSILFEWKTNGINKFFSDSKVLYFHKDYNKKIDKLTVEDILEYDLVITTYSMCSRTCSLGKYHESRRRIPDKGKDLLYYLKWNRIVLDESHKYCNVKTKTFKYLMALKAKYKWCVTGTPIINYDTDIWGQLQLCGYKDITSVNEWKHEGIRLFTTGLKYSIYSLNYTDVNIRLPELIEKDIVITLNNNHKDLYDILLGEVKQSYYNMVQLKESYSCVFAMFTRLRQSAIAPYIISCEAKRSTKLINTFNLDKEKHGINTNKMTATIDILKNFYLGEKINAPTSLYNLCYRKIQQDPKLQLPDLEIFHPQRSKIIIFSMFTSALDLVGETIKKHIPYFKYVQIDGDTRNRENVLTQFKFDPKINCLLTTYKVAAEGLNLTEANSCILLEPWWNNATLKQAKARLWRIGQTKPVTVYNLIAKDTIEEKIREICEKKDGMIESYLNGTRKNIQNCGLNKAVLHKIFRNA